MFQAQVARYANGQPVEFGEQLIGRADCERLAANNAARSAVNNL
jgi:hypothetical protein